ncbi:MAG: hypothetical protein JXR73_01375 [Candidatus Omnitrophica bacterium]|nr:hypothetical protein [Candidatus Omnitrophota bacterium]
MPKLFFIGLWMISQASYAAEEPKETSGSAWKSIAKPGDVFLLEYQFEPDQVQTIISDATMEFKNQIGAMSMPMTMTVQSTISLKTLSVDEDGAAQLEIQIDSIDAEMSVLGQKQKMPPQMLQSNTDTIRVSSNGQWLQGAESFSPAVMGPSSPGAAMMMQSLFILLPQEKKSVGEAWTQEVDLEIPGASQKIKETIESVLKDVVDMNGEKAAVISTKCERTGKDIQIDASALSKGGAPMPPQAGAITISETNQTRELLIYLNLDEGSVISVHEISIMDTSFGGFGGAGQNIKTNMYADISLKASRK